jgi:hypothetical protein
MQLESAKFGEYLATAENANFVGEWHATACLVGCRTD